MKTNVFLVVVAVAWCLRVAAETNSAPMGLAFALPCPQLRPLARAEMKTVEVKEEPGLTGQGERSRLGARVVDEVQQTRGSDLFSISVRGSDLEMQVCRKLEEGGYLLRPEEPTPLEHFMERSFSPEIIHFGHAKAYCTLYTAIVRRNPLCLLNPMFLFVSW